MGKIKLKIDKLNLPDEFIFESNFINNEEELNTELGWSEIMDAIMDKLIIEKEFVDNIVKECPEEGNIRCIDCSCNLCENDCQECDVEGCEPRIIVHK